MGIFIPGHLYLVFYRPFIPECAVLSLGLETFCCCCCCFIENILHAFGVAVSFLSAHISKAVSSQSSPVFHTFFFFKKVYYSPLLSNTSLPSLTLFSSRSIILIKLSVEVFIWLIDFFFSFSAWFQFGFSSASLPWLPHFPQLFAFIFLKYFHIFSELFEHNYNLSNSTCLNIIIIFWILHLAVLPSHSYRISNFRRWHIVLICMYVIFVSSLGLVHLK